MKIQEKALRVIEGLALGDCRPTDKVLEVCHKFSHVALGDCENTHEDWRKELNETYRALKKKCVI